MEAIVGRRGELEAIERFLGALADRSPVLVLEGEPGIGKTTLMRAGVEAARRRPALVLACVGSASETRLAYAALADLLRGVDGEVVAGLPGPQKEALEAALLRAGPAGGDLDRHAVASAVLSVLEAIGRQGEAVLAIDDLHWLDGASAGVVEFCARRLPPRVGLLASRRLGQAPWMARLERLGASDPIEVRRLGPLDAGELAGLLSGGGGRVLERQALARVHEASGGNPLYALELARALPEGAPPSAALALPASLEEAVAARVAGLDADVEEALLAVALLASPTIELIERALGTEAADRLDDAERRGMIELEGPRVRFAHPLLAGGVYGRATSGQRRAMHRRLAGAVSGVAGLEERARHLAYAGMPEALAALDQAARHLCARGAPAAAAELLELAIERGGGGQIRMRAARHHNDAGDPRRARTLLEEAIGQVTPGEDRARAMLLLAEVHSKVDSLPAAREQLERARSEAGADERLRVAIDLRLAFTLFNLGTPADAMAPARAALERAQGIGDPGLLGEALATAVMTDYCFGLGLDEERLASARELEGADLLPDVELQPALIAGFLFVWAGRFDEARSALLAVAAGSAERGLEQSLAWVAFPRVWLECWAGDLAGASALAAEGTERLRLLGTTVGSALALLTRAMVDAHAGRADEARRACTEASELFERAAWRGALGWVAMTLGSLELSVGDLEAAAAALAPLVAIQVGGGMPEPTAGGLLIGGDAAEALAATGRIEEAEAIVALLERRGAALDRAWAIAVGARCRGILLAAGGDVAGAEAALERALVAHERLPMPIERGRSLLVLGRIRRRLRKRRAAKAALEEALATFEAAGAARWAEQAAAEIAAIGLRPRSTDTLTPAEERVARLAASGMTNQQVAAVLVVSAKTVEAHLGRAYRKLGIRTRAELGAQMAQHTAQPAGQGPPVP